MTRPIVLAWLLVAGTYAMASQPGKGVAVPVGETLQYDVSWANLLTAATATVTVREERAGGQSLYVMAGDGQPTSLLAALYPVSYRVSTTLNAASLLPTVFTVTSEERGTTRTRETRFDRKNNRIQYEVRGSGSQSSAERTSLAAPPDVRDPLSALYLARTLPLKTGLQQSLPITFNGRLQQSRLSVGAREQVRSGLGMLDAWRVTIVLADSREGEGRDLAVWIADAPHRAPLKLQAAVPVGSFVLTLSSMTGGR